MALRGEDGDSLFGDENEVNVGIQEEQETIEGIKGSYKENGNEVG